MGLEEINQSGTAGIEEAKPASNPCCKKLAGWPINARLKESE
jgi:hypothetical protein